MENKPLEKYKLELKEITKENSGLFTKIHCPSCTEEVDAANLQLNDKIGKCTHCNAVFPFQKEIAHLFKEENKREEVSRPAGIDVVHFQDEIDFTIEQPAPVLDILGVIFLSLFGFLATLIYFKKGISILIPGFLWFGSAFCLYNILTRKKNKIYLNIDRNNLTVKWRPKKMMTDKVIDIQEIDQVYLKTDSMNFSLHLILNGIDGQKHVPLINSVGNSLAKARYLEQEIEKHLGIKDRKVPESNVTV